MDNTAFFITAYDCFMMLLGIVIEAALIIIAISFALHYITKFIDSITRLIYALIAVAYQQRCDARDLEEKEGVPCDNDAAPCS